MSVKNLCKFIPDRAKNELKTVKFILDTDPLVQKAQTELKTHLVFLIKSGEGVMNFNRETVSVKAGDMVFGFSGEKFKAVGTDLQYYYICFEGSRADELFSRFGINSLNR